MPSAKSDVVRSMGRDFLSTKNLITGSYSWYVMYSALVYEIRCDVDNDVYQWQKW